MEDRSLQIKIITFFMIVIPVVIVSYVFIWENASQRKAAEVEKNLTITAAFAQLIEKNVEDRIDLMTNLARMMNLADSKYPALKEILRSLKTSAEENYFIADANGNVLVSSNYGPENSDRLKFNSRYFQKAVQGETVVTPMELSPFSGEYVIAIYTPVLSGIYTNSVGGVEGVIAGELPVSYFKRTLELAVIGNNGKLALTDNRGNYIYGKDIDNKTQLVASNCFFDAKGEDKAVVERPSLRTKAANVFTLVRLKRFGWYTIAVQPSKDLSTPGLIVLTQNFIILLLIVITVFVLWRYKVSLEYRNQLVKRQRAEKLALVGELAAGMAHEIRNPLTAVKGLTQLLKSKEKYAEDREVLDLIGGSVDHIEGIVSETLLLAKPQTMRVTNIPLRKLIQETFKFMGNEAVSRGVNLELASGTGECIVSGDQIHLKQVLVNVIKNALEASVNNGHIRINLEPTGSNTALVTVSDDGTGIKPGVLDKIGTPFFTTKPSGTGLGLSVSKRIIEEHGGTFNIASIPGKGTTVKIELPCVLPGQALDHISPAVR